MSQIPESPSGVTANAGYRPWDADPDMLAGKIAESLIDKLGTPTVINKEFASWYGVAEGLYASGLYDSRGRTAIFKAVAGNSVNIEGRYFERAWAYLMKPKYSIMGLPLGAQQQEEKQSITSRIATWWRGGGGDKNAATGTTGKS